MAGHGATLRRALHSGRQLGVWAALGDPHTTEVLGRSGFDLVVVDLQHGFATEADLPGQLDVLSRTPSFAVVRVAGLLPHQVMRCLDLGADGVVVPMVETARAAADAVAAARYAPAGGRSWGPLWSQLGRPLAEPAAADATAAVIVMIETAAGLANLDEILAVDGIDAVYIGPNDLALSLGLGRVSWRDAELTRAATSIIERARAAGVAAGIDCQGREAVDFWAERGGSLFVAGRDVDLLAGAARQAAGELRA